eukprot:GHUV01027140.1.p1 GENE.GHUV01027140.1~~GHUV01027140.1.p1  ORF type:complete len:135 (-),score=5.81 GHUV01027140.1:1165-1569(-)
MNEACTRPFIPSPEAIPAEHHICVHKWCKSPGHRGRGHHALVGVNLRLHSASPQSPWMLQSCIWLICLTGLSCYCPAKAPVIPCATACFFVCRMSSCLITLLTALHPSTASATHSSNVSGGNLPSICRQQEQVV